MKPLIGVSASIEQDEKNYFIHRDNCLVIEEAGGIPFILPHSADENTIKQIAFTIDGLYLTGGNDINPFYFNEEPHPKLGHINPTRDFFEKAIIEEVLDLKKPILGVCRGEQMLNVALGGSLYQDLYSQNEEELLQHSQKAPIGHRSHFVNIIEGTLLHRIIGENKITVNSRHHQAVRELGSGLQCSGTSSDHVIEAIESIHHPFVLGVQWHPENLAIHANDAASKKIYASFIKACQSKG